MLTFDTSNPVPGCGASRAEEGRLPDSGQPSPQTVNQGNTEGSGSCPRVKDPWGWGEVCREKIRSFRYIVSKRELKINEWSIWLKQLGKGQKNNKAKERRKKALMKLIDNEWVTEEEMGLINKKLFFFKWRPEPARLERKKAQETQNKKWEKYNLLKLTRLHDRRFWTTPTQDVRVASQENPTHTFEEQVLPVLIKLFHRK